MAFNRMGYNSFILRLGICNLLVVIYLGWCNVMRWKKTKVEFEGEIDGECLPIKCLCGHGGYWNFFISIYQDDPYVCPECGREYYFKNAITVFVKEPEDI